MDPLIATLLLGGGLLFCGFLLGKNVWIRYGEAATLKLLYDEKLLDPKVVVDHFTKKPTAQPAEEKE